MDQKTQDADALEARVRAELPPANTWTMPPRGYRQGLALCIVDGVSRQLIGTRADSLVAAFRDAVGPDAEAAGVTALEPHVAELAEELMATTQPADSTAVAIALASALEVFRESGVEATSELVARLNDEGLHGQLAKAWAANESLTHRMLTDTAMLSGYLDPEVDQVMVRYVAEAIGTDPRPTPPARVIAALTNVAARMDAKILPLEFAILNFVRG